MTSRFTLATTAAVLTSVPLALVALLRHGAVRRDDLVLDIEAIDVECQLLERNDDVPDDTDTPRRVIA